MGRSRNFYRPAIDEFTRRISSWHWSVKQVDLDDFLADPPEDGAYDDLAIAGGDGTVNACLNPAGQHAILILPSGSGNDLARSLGILTISDSVSIFSTGRLARIDIGEVRHDHGRELFSNGIGIGLDGIISRQHSRGLPYSISAAAQTIQLPRFSATLVVEEEVPRTLEFLSIVVANGKFFGGGYKLAPDAEIDDGLLDVILASPVTRGRYLRSLLRARSGAHTKDSAVSSQKVMSLSIESERKLPWHVDGEYRESKRIEIKIFPEARSFYAAL